MRVIRENYQHITLNSEKPNVKIKDKKHEIKTQFKKDGSKVVVEGELALMR
jgi:RNase P/RNase MRP subunit p29